jgi:hypothetical protein
VKREFPWIQKTSMSQRETSYIRNFFKLSHYIYFRKSILAVEQHKFSDSLVNFSKMILPRKKSTNLIESFMNPRDIL